MSNSDHGEPVGAHPAGAAAGDRGLTRRAVLAGAAAAGAGALVQPVGAAARALGPGMVFSVRVGTLEGDSRAVTAPRRFALVGVEWRTPAAVEIELRSRARDNRWSRWVPASVLGHGPDHHAARSMIGEPVWTGPADWVQLRTAGRVQDVRLHFIAFARLPRGEGAAASAGAAALPLAKPVLDAGPGQPAIIARRVWSGGARPAVAPAYGSVRLAFVHHTENTNGYSAGEVPAMLLAIYHFHRFVRGWNDIGYNFVVDLFGRIWEARAGGIDAAVVGAQAGGYNTVSTGASVLGSFIDVVPSPAALDALEHLLAWKLSLHGAPAQGLVEVEVDPAGASYTPFKPGARVRLPRVAGHRDGDATSCPGNAFYARLPALRPRIANLARSPALLTISPAGAALTAPATASLEGRLTLLNGAPLAGAPLELQQLAATGAVTLERLTSAGDGSWSTSREVVRSARLRVLHRSAPAAVSDYTEIAVAPRLELSVQSLSPLRLRGSAFPPKRHAVIEVRRLVHGRPRRVMRKRVRLARGSFQTRIGLRRPGRYELRLRTRADASNAAGVSPPLLITV